jgi:hypothetical protein
MLCKHAQTYQNFAAVEAKAGDTFILHGLLPHTNSYNYKHYPRVITNPHVTLKEPYNLNRGPKDGDYVSSFRFLSCRRGLKLYTLIQKYPNHSQSLLEKVILRALSRTAVPEYEPTRPRMFWYPRNSAFKLNKVDDELARLKADRALKGLPESSIDSVYVQGGKAMEDFIKHNGYDLPFNTDLGLELKQHAA